MAEQDLIYLEKAVQSLEGASSEQSNRRFNNAANRSYYAVFQAAIFALIHDGIQPRDPERGWSHSFVQAQFNGELVRRRHRYASDVGETLTRNYLLREAADYRRRHVADVQSARAVRRAREFLQAVQTQTGGGGST